MIEKHRQYTDGYTPFLIRSGWQVAELRYAHELRFNAVTRVERHNHTDEVFIALKGRPVLGAAAFDEAGKVQIEAEPMKPLVTYNIPQGVWHTICMSPDDVVIIVEASHTHENDVEYRNLPGDQASRLNHVMQEARL